MEISFLTNISKKKLIILVTLNEYNDMKAILNQYQFRFNPKLGTTMQLAALCDNITNHLN